MSLLDIIAEDKLVIIYRPRLNDIAGDANSTILLCQIIYWRKHMGRAFYKPISVGGPTQTDKSLANELGFTKKEVERAAKNLAKRGLIRYWYQRLDHKMWWDVAPYLEEKIRQCYKSNELSSCNYTKAPKGVSGKSERGFGEMPKGHMDITEITSEITSSSSLTPPAEEEGIRDIALPVLPYPFDKLLPAHRQEALRLCSKLGLNLQEQVQAIKALNTKIANPAHYLLAVLRKGGLAGAAELAATVEESAASLAINRKRIEDAQRRGDIPRWARQVAVQGECP